MRKSLLSIGLVVRASSLREPAATRSAATRSPAWTTGSSGKLAAAVALTILAACITPPQPSTPERSVDVPAPRQPLRWVNHNDLGGGAGWSPVDADRRGSIVVSGVEQARLATQDLRPRAVIIEPAHLCAVATVLRSAAPRISIDLADAHTPITAEAADCLRSIRPAAMTFTISDPPAGPLSTPVTTLLTQLFGCEALAVDHAGDAVAKLLGERAGSADGVSLRSLTLSHSLLSAEGLRALSTRKSLRAVGLPVMKRADERSSATGLGELATLPELEWLDLAHGPVNDGDLGLLSRGRRLRWLSVAGTEIDDRGMTELSNAANLEYLDVGFTSITDAGVEALSRLTHLNTLTLSKTGVTDRGMVFVARLTSLRRLRLELTAVTDAGLTALGALPELRLLAVPKTVTPEAIERFRAEHPRVEIEYLIL
jgi:hypothetical protein